MFCRNHISLFCESHIGFKVITSFKWWGDIDDLVQDCSISTANTLEILQSFTNPSIYYIIHQNDVILNQTFTYGIHIYNPKNNDG